MIWIYKEHFVADSKAELSSFIQLKFGRVCYFGELPYARIPLFTPREKGCRYVRKQEFKYKMKRMRRLDVLIKHA